MVYSITDYGAQAGKSCSAALQQAIDAAWQAGGGTVVVPAGQYGLETVRLRSNITLYLEAGALLKGSGQIEDYSTIGYYHNELGEVACALYAIDSENICICGRGVIDLNGQSFYDSSRPILPPGQHLNEKQVAQCTWSHEKRLNQPVFFLRCRNITLKEIEVCDAPCWTLTFCECNVVRLLDLTIENHPNLPNNDGVHCCSTNDVVIRGCKMNCADDCVALSGITNWNIPTENVVISDCIFHSHSKAVVVGYMQSIVRNVTINNLVITESNRGICIMSSQKDGLVENVTVSNCVIDTKVRAGNWWGNGEPIFLMGTYHHGYEQEIYDRNWPVNINGVSFSNIICHGENCIGIIGVEGNIRNITLRDVQMTLKDSENLLLKGRINDLAPSQQTETIPQDGQDYWLVARECETVRILDCFAGEFHGKQPQTCFVQVKNLQVR